MQNGSVTLVANVPTLLPIPGGLVYGVRLLVRVSPSGNVYYGTNNQVSTTTGTLIAQGAPNVSTPTTVPKDHFSPTGAAPAGQLYVVGDSPCVVDWSAQ